MWFTFVTARLFHSLSLQPRLAATLLSSCSVANSPTRRVGLAPTLRPASLAQAPFPPVQFNCRFQIEGPQTHGNGGAIWADSVCHLNLFKRGCASARLRLITSGDLRQCYWNCEVCSGAR